MQRQSLRSKILHAVYDKLLAHYGPQHWWPAKTPFEVCVGAILVQNTNWQNVEKAITNLRREQRLSFRRLYACSPDQLKELIRPAGFFNVKAERLRNFLGYLSTYYKGQVERMRDVPSPVLRTELLGVNGIGPETADSILLYALGRPVFVVDAYTRRFLFRHGFEKEARDYASMQELFRASLPADAALFNEYHALIVALGKDWRADASMSGGYPLKERKYFL